MTPFPDGSLNESSSHFKLAHRVDLATVFEAELDPDPSLLHCCETGTLLWTFGDSTWSGVMTLPQVAYLQSKEIQLPSYDQKVLQYL